MKALFVMFSKGCNLMGEKYENGEDGPSLSLLKQHASTNEYSRDIRLEHEEFRDGTESGAAKQTIKVNGNLNGGLW
ncbi:MAG: hypothetical protein ACR2N1_23520 [Rubripirellula sp.]